MPVRKAYEQEENQRLDVLRGLLMTLVVLGHCIQYVADPTDFDHNLIFRAIYSFHMPSFMFLSGYVAQLVHPHSTYKQLGKRIESLLAVPWNVFGVGLVRMYFLWYTLGFITPAFWGHIPCKRVIKVAALVGWPVAACFWMRNADPLFANWIHLTGMKARMFHYFCSVYRLYLTPLLGIIFIWVVSCKVWKYLPVNFLQTVGKNTIAIYALQYYCWVRVFSIVLGNVMASFILALLVPILFAKTVSKYRLIAYMFSGKC